MSVWMIRAGKNGEYEDWSIDNNFVAVAWRRMSDLRPLGDQTELEAALQQAYPDARLSRIKSHASQLHAFAHRIVPGDLIATPLRARACVALGEVTGPYAYRTDHDDTARHVRPVRWMRADLPRTELDDDLLFSLGAMQTVCRVRCLDAEERLREKLRNGRMEESIVDATIEMPVIDLELAAREQMREFVGTHYHGHALAGLVNELLRAQGYLTRMAPPGPDGGVDILAGSGRMGFDHPHSAFKSSLETLLSA